MKRGARQAHHVRLRLHTHYRAEVKRNRPPCQLVYFLYLLVDLNVTQSSANYFPLCPQTLLKSLSIIRQAYSNKPCSVGGCVECNITCPSMFLLPHQQRKLVSEICKNVQYTAPTRSTASLCPTCIPPSEIRTESTHLASIICTNPTQLDNRVPDRYRMDVFGAVTTHRPHSRCSEVQRDGMIEGVRFVVVSMKGDALAFRDTKAGPCLIRTLCSEPVVQRRCYWFLFFYGLAE